MLNLHMCYAHVPPLPPKDLGPPAVSIIAEENFIAGREHALLCIVETEEGVRMENISVQWTGPDGGALNEDSIMIRPTTTNGVVTTGRLQFFPLHTSDRGNYTCTGRISATSVGVDVSSSDTMSVNVISRFLSASLLLCTC